ncbi:hypothetical protein HK102_013895 [Quaeritorhiza haematococci]|nr:hypothetical protein HK102_013895 [Quaeritorhiza haematococci]
MSFSVASRTLLNRALAGTSAGRPTFTTASSKFIHTSRPSQKATATMYSDTVESVPMPGCFDFENQPQPKPKIPAYLSDTYTWSYLDPANVPYLNNDFTVATLLFGWANTLFKSAVNEFSPGMRVLQPAAVYGKFSKLLAERLGSEGHLVVSDVAPIQLQTLRPSIAHLENVTLRLADARHPIGTDYDGVCCFFLLHEVPDDVKADIITALMESVRPGGKAVFVDYHNPSKFHPLRPLLSFVADTLEPFAKGLWRTDIKEYCRDADKYEWSKELKFGGLYQKVVAYKPESS